MVESVANLADADQAFIAELRLKMVKFATLQLNDSQLAEDAVQEALMGALKNATSFTRKAALSTWVFAILRHKIGDSFRKKSQIKESQAVCGDDENDPMDRLFDGKGAWQVEKRPESWPQPMDAVKDDHFWSVFDACVNDLPSKQATLFMMREFIELESDEICAAMDISTSNLHVMLHRSRLNLRDCLDHRWFAA